MIFTQYSDENSTHGLIHQSDFAAHIWWNYKQAVFTKENTIFQEIPLIGISDISVKQQVLYISAYMHHAVSNAAIYV